MSINLTKLNIGRIYKKIGEFLIKFCILFTILNPLYIFAPSEIVWAETSSGKEKKQECLKELSKNICNVPIEFNIINKLLFSIYIRDNNFSKNDAIDITTLMQSSTFEKRFNKSIKMCLEKIKPNFEKIKNQLKKNQDILASNFQYENMHDPIELVEKHCEMILEKTVDCPEEEFAQFSLTSTAFIYAMHLAIIDNSETSYQIFLLIIQNINNYANYSFCGIHASSNFKANILSLFSCLIPNTSITDKIEYEKIWNNNLWNQYLLEIDQTIFKISITNKDINMLNEELLDLANYNYSVNIINNDYDYNTLRKQDIFFTIYSTLTLYENNKFKHGKDLQQLTNSKLSNTRKYLEAKYSSWDFWMTTIDIFGIYPILTILIIDLILRHALGNALYILSWAA